MSKRKWFECQKKMPKPHRLLWINDGNKTISAVWQYGGFISSELREGESFANFTWTYQKSAGES